MWRIIWLVLWVMSAVCDGFRCYRKVKTNDTCKGQIRKEINSSEDCCRLPNAKGFFAVKETLAKNLYRCIPCDNVPVDGQWVKWSTWTNCNSSCEGGTKKRTRRCVGGHNCTGEASQTRVCHNSRCTPPMSQSGPLTKVLVNGTWAQWTSWTKCAVNCGVIQRTRSCYHPRGAVNCLGSNKETKICHGTNSTALCVGDGGWGEWSKWRRCSSSCGESITYRTRKCVNPPSINGRAFCLGDHIDTSPCYSAPCPINGNWGQWTKWTECAVNCGVVQRTRSCDTPRARFGGNDCSGHNRETKKCNGESATDLCPVDGGWTEWSSWHRCVAMEACGIGRHYRTRKCTNPKPYKGQDCKGKGYDTRHCRETFLCKI